MGESCVYDGQCDCHDSSTFASGLGAKDAICSYCGCDLPTGAVSHPTGYRLKKYTRHLPDCASWMDEHVKEPRGCTCGLTAALEEMKP